jgi:hypothetical protein
LRAAGHEAVHWSEVGNPRAPDTVLMQWAIANGYTVFTHDLDFGTMLALSQGLLEVCPSETCQAAAPTVRCAGPALDPWPLSPPPSLLLQAI